MGIQATQTLWPGRGSVPKPKWNETTLYDPPDSHLCLSEREGGGSGAWVWCSKLSMLLWITESWSLLYSHKKFVNKIWYSVFYLWTRLVPLFLVRCLLSIIWLVFNNILKAIKSFERSDHFPSAVACFFLPLRVCFVRKTYLILCILCWTPNLAIFFAWWGDQRCATHPSTDW